MTLESTAVSSGVASRLLRFARWLVFVPAGLLGGVLVSLIWSLFSVVTSWFYGWPAPSPWSPAAKMGNSFLCGYAIVAIGALVAPTARKLIPAVVTLGAAIAFAFLGSLAAFTRSDLGGIIYNACIAGGGAAGVYHAYHGLKMNA